MPAESSHGVQPAGTRSFQGRGTDLAGKSCESRSLAVLEWNECPSHLSRAQPEYQRSGSYPAILMDQFGSHLQVLLQIKRAGSSGATLT